MGIIKLWTVKEKERERKKKRSITKQRKKNKKGYKIWTIENDP